MPEAPLSAFQGSQPNAFFYNMTCSPLLSPFPSLEEIVPLLNFMVLMCSIMYTTKFSLYLFIPIKLYIFFKVLTHS